MQKELQSLQKSAPFAKHAAAALQSSNMHGRAEEEEEAEAEGEE